MAGMSTAIKAVVFDMDGVLTDTETIWDEVRRQLAAADSVRWPDGATDAILGMSTPEWARYLVDVVGVHGSPPEVAQRTIAAMAARYRQHLPTLPGAAHAVERIAAHWPLGLASSSPRRLIDIVLAQLDIASYFQATVSTEEVAAGKPAPDGYLRVCELLGVSPTHAVAVEDSSNGLRSAAAAGMRVVAVPQPAFPPAPDALSLAHVTIESLDDLTTGVIEATVLVHR